MIRGDVLLEVKNLMVVVAYDVSTETLRGSVVFVWWRRHA